MDDYDICKLYIYIYIYQHRTEAEIQLESIEGTVYGRTVRDRQFDGSSTVVATGLSVVLGGKSCAPDPFPSTAFDPRSLAAGHAPATGVT